MTVHERVPRPSERRMLVDHVYDALLEDLMDGWLAAGSAISIERTGRHLDVSATAVREALARLEATGLIRRTALRGYRVTPPLSPEELADLMHARQVIEAANTELVCQHGGPAMLSALQSTVDDLRRGPAGAVVREVPDLLAGRREVPPADRRERREPLPPGGVHGPRRPGAAVPALRWAGGHRRGLRDRRAHRGPGRAESRRCRGGLGGDGRAHPGRTTAGHDPGRAQIPGPPRRTAR